MYSEYKDRAAFYVVYIQEAHAADLWQLPSNIRDNVVFAMPKDFAERGQRAESCVRNLGIQIPAVIDGIDNAVDTQWTGWPDRLYVIAKDGRIAYKSEPGPFGFKPEEVRKVLQSTYIW